MDRTSIIAANWVLYMHLTAPKSILKSRAWKNALANTYVDDFGLEVNRAKIVRDWLFDTVLQQVYLGEKHDDKLGAWNRMMEERTIKSVKKCASLFERTGKYYSILNMLGAFMRNIDANEKTPTSDGRDIYYMFGVYISTIMQYSVEKSRKPRKEVWESFDLPGTLNKICA